MDLTFLKYLPSEIIINILSRLPIKTIMNCKCVSKSWYELLKSPYFVHSHLSKSIPGLILHLNERPSRYFQIFEFEDELDDQLEHDETRYKPILKWDFPNDHALMEGSANGLLCLSELGSGRVPDSLYVCNPITREYIELPNLEGIVMYPSIVTYGFGISKTTSQYKVVRIFHECLRDETSHVLLSIPKSECLVYTLGTRSWRKSTINGPGLDHEYSCRSNGAFLNGNLHWIVSDLKGTILISCFDLETERFSTSPFPFRRESGRYLCGLTVLGDCLCVCDNTSDYEIEIWVMKEYGVEKSWTKEFTIKKSPDHAGEHYEVVYPIKVYRDGDVLLFWEDFYMFYYSEKTKSTETMDFLQLQNCGSLHARLHVSSFVSLRNFTNEVVKSF